MHDLDAPTSSKRLSVTLSAQDRRDLRLIRRSPTAMASLPAEAATVDSALVHAVLEKGLEIMRQQELEDRYAQMAKEEQPGSRDARRARAMQRPRGTAGPQ